MSIEVSGIGSAGRGTLQSGHGSPTLSQEQRRLIEETLAGYDAKNLTQSDASAIVEAFSEAGILPGRTLAEAMGELGFDSRAVGEMAGVGPARGDGPPPPRDGNGGVQTLNISDDMLQELNQLLNAYYEEGQPEDTRTSTLDAIRDIFRQTMPEGGLVDIKA